jgi:hypothetical protein
VVYLPRPPARYEDNAGISILYKELRESYA